MTGFLNPREIVGIRRDFSNLVASAGGVAVTISYVSSVSGGTWDPTYEQWVGGTKNYGTIDTRVLQHFLGERDQDLMEFGFVKVGDCLFSLLPSVDLEGKEEVTITDPDGGVWVPVVVPTRAFYEYTDVRLGSVQVSQSILARLRQ